MTAVPDESPTDQAAQWFTRMNRNKIDKEELRVFQAWRLDPENLAAYVVIETAWLKAGELAKEANIQAATPPAPPARASVGWAPIPRPKNPFGMAAIAGAFTAGLILLCGLPVRSDMTIIGAPGLLDLADASKVGLNSDGAVQALMRPPRRPPKPLA